jgi:hypothetical protein
MSAPRRSARLASKSTNQPVAVQPSVVVAVFSQPTAAATAAAAVVATAPATVVATNKKEEIVSTIKKYLESMDYARGIGKVKVVIDVYEFIDKNFDFINTVEFHETKRFVLTVHEKAIELERDVSRMLEQDGGSSSKDYDVCMQAIKILQRVHTKCHLYGMGHFATADPIYKKFLDTYIEKFL